MTNTKKKRPDATPDTGADTMHRRAMTDALQSALNNALGEITGSAAKAAGSALGRDVPAAEMNEFISARLSRLDPGVRRALRLMIMAQAAVAADEALGWDSGIGSEELEQTLETGSVVLTRVLMDPESDPPEIQKAQATAALLRMCEYVMDGPDDAAEQPGFLVRALHRILAVVPERPEILRALVDSGVARVGAVTTDGKIVEAAEWDHDREFAGCLKAWRRLGPVEIGRIVSGTRDAWHDRLEPRENRPLDVASARLTSNRISVAIDVSRKLCDVGHLDDATASRFVEELTAIRAEIDAEISRATGKEFDA